MASNLQQALSRFELLVQAGELDYFILSIHNKALVLQPADTESGLQESIAITDDLIQSMENYFYGMPYIQSNSSDYTCLKSFINARASIENLLPNRKAL